MTPELIDRLVDEFDERFDEPPPAVGVDDLCVCGHTFGEHRPGCDALIIAAGREQFCTCTDFELDDELSNRPPGSYGD
ncbi:hypothetical protein LV457_02785 [Mycobacterium sp. MYCO198283]|uniref:hypothetical protein n=1 Tax=Mycobacterium sp. MYCO198283 TaxID=2883505 RepID=UPI001E2D4113|nr:hypothetical protein [Mycobacterium sp. MYCO198283]MCG5431215.1 hypothetical protein [Mycobacterium sp. MYCO198283]